MILLGQSLKEMYKGCLAYPVYSNGELCYCYKILQDWKQSKAKYRQSLNLGEILFIVMFLQF